MHSDDTAATSKRTAHRCERLFTVESANRALVFVRKVVGDIVNEYDRLMRLRERREDLALRIAGGTELATVRSEIENTSERLRELHDELSDVGCELKDWLIGLVDFPALHEGRKVWLCWKLGDPEILFWHELYSGFASRRPLTPDFGRPCCERPEPAAAPVEF